MLSSDAIISLSMGLLAMVANGIMIWQAARINALQQVGGRSRPRRRRRRKSFTLSRSMFLTYICRSEPWDCITPLLQSRILVELTPGKYCTWYEATVNCHVCTWHVHGLWFEISCHWRWTNAEVCLSICKSKHWHSPWWGREPIASGTWSRVWWGRGWMFRAVSTLNIALIKKTRSWLTFFDISVLHRNNIGMLHLVLILSFSAVRS